MRRLLFGLWLAGTGFASFLVADALFPGLWLARTVALLFWVSTLVPLSFLLWFRAQRRREEQDVDRALEAWRTHQADAGRALATALQEALDDEDETSLRRLLPVLERENAYVPFVTAARAWLQDDGSRARRNDHLDEVKALARPIFPDLARRV